MEGTVGGSAVLAVAVAVLDGALLLAWPWTRRRLRWAVVAVAVLCAYVAWHAVLVLTHADSLNVDYPFTLGLSVEDIGSGVACFALAVAVLALAERGAAAGRVAAVAAIAALVAVVFDRFT